MLLPYPPSEQQHPFVGGGFQLISSSPMFNYDGLNELLAAHFPPPSSSNPPPTPDPPAESIKVPPAAAGGSVSRRRRAARRDRHCKIVTAQGERDRRMRLSLDVARRFFNLQDLLGHDKPSKTISWLLGKSRSAIKDLSAAAAFCVAGSGSPAKSENSTLECDELPAATNIVSARKEAAGGGRKARRAPAAGGGFAAAPSKETRARARERARERTREKRRYLSPNEANPATHHGHFGYPNNEAVDGGGDGGDVGAVDVAESFFRVNWSGMAAAGMFGGGGAGAVDVSAKPWEDYGGIF